MKSFRCTWINGGMTNRVAIAAAALVMMPGLGAQSASVLKPIYENERVTAWDLRLAAGIPEVLLQAGDSVVVHLAPESIQGKVEFVAEGGGLAEKLMASGALRSAVVSLKDFEVPVLENRSGHPDAFPRPGNLKKVLDNARVTVWDFTFAPGQTVAMHFHPRDVIAVSLKDGDLIGMTPDGQKTPSSYFFGTIRFNPRNRTHTETLVRGEARIIAIELK